MVDHVYVRVGDPSCSGFSDIVWENGQTIKHIPLNTVTMRG